MHELNERIKANPHLGAIVILLFRCLSREENNILFGSRLDSSSNYDEKQALENCATQILRFFSEPDSADENWYFEQETRMPNAPPDSSANAYNQSLKAFYALTYDALEDEATDDAERGDFRGLEALVTERGYLRTAKARKLVAAKLRGDRIERAVSKHYIQCFEEILQIMLLKQCSETAARAYWLRQHDAAYGGSGSPYSQDTLKTNCNRAKKDRGMQIKLAAIEMCIDETRRRNGNPPISTANVRGIDRIKQLCEKDGWVQD